MKVNMKELNELKHKWYEARDVANEARTAYLNKLNEVGMFCDTCGETDPKHNFYPLQSFGMTKDGRSKQHTGLQCNKCALTPEEYEKRFGGNNEEDK